MGKIRASFRYNLAYNSLLAGAGAAVYLIYALVTGNWNLRDGLLPVAMLLANAFGLLLIVVFLGSGLIDLPRELWYAAYNKRTLRFLQYRAPSVREAYLDADAELNFVAKAVAYVNARVPEISELRPLVSRLVNKVQPPSPRHSRSLIFSIY